MGNKTKLALSSAFACTMALGLIGCNKEQPVGPVIPAEYNVSFTSEDLELKTNVTKIASDEDLVLKIQVKNEKKDEGKRLPKLNNVEEKDFITINSGNKVLQFTDYNYVIDDSKEFATLSLKHEHYLGDIDIKAKAADIVTFSDTKLAVAGFGNTADKTTVLIDTAAEGFAAPEIVHEVFFNGPLAESYFYDNSEGYGKLEIYHEDGVIPDSIVVKADAEQVTTNKLKIRFQGDEVGWGYDVGGAPHYTNRTYLADIVFDNWEEEEVIWAEGSNVVKKYVTVDRGSDLSATISLNDWSDFDEESPMPMKDYKKNFNYTHELSDERDVEGSLKDFVVIGHKPDGKGTEVVQSRLYTFVLSEHGRVANFNLDSSICSKYTELEIICNVRQVANGVYVNFNRLNEYLTFGRHNYLYEDGDDLKFEINLAPEVTDYVLPKDEDTGDNGRVQIGFKEVGKGENPDWLFKLDPEDYKYEIQDGDVRHQARVVIPRDKVEIDLEKIHQEDIVVEVSLVGKYDVYFDGDTTHLDFVGPETKWQDEDLEAKISLYAPKVVSKEAFDDTDPNERSYMYDYDSTFRLADENDDNFEELFNIVGYDDEGKPTGITNFEYEVKEDPDNHNRLTAFITVPESAIGSYSSVVITSYAVRTHIIAAPILDSNDEYSDYIQYREIEYSDPNATYTYDDFDGRWLYLAVNELGDNLNVNVELTQAAKDAHKKLLDSSMTDATYEYYGNYQYTDDSWTTPYIDSYASGDAEFEFKINPVTREDYKWQGTLSVPTPVDYSYEEPDPDVEFGTPYNEDMMLYFNGEPDTLIHDLLVSDDKEHAVDLHYYIVNAVLTTSDTSAIQPYRDSETGIWKWVEPMPADGELTITIKLKDQYKDWIIDQSMATEAWVLQEDYVTDIALDNLVTSIEWSKDTVNKVITCIIHQPKAGDEWKQIVGDIRIDLWAPIPPTNA